MIQAITQTVEEEEYPSKRDGKGSCEQWDRSTDPDGEWTSEGHGETHASSHERDPAPVIQAARMLVRERKPAPVGKLSGTAEYPPQAVDDICLGRFSMEKHLSTHKRLSCQQTIHRNEER